jgi:hypothetical protein
MFSGVLFSKVILILIKILRRGSPALLRDHPPSRDLLIARIQPSAVL